MANIYIHMYRVILLSFQHIFQMLENLLRHSKYQSQRVHLIYICLHFHLLLKVPCYQDIFCPYTLEHSGYVEIQNQAGQQISSFWRDTQMLLNLWHTPQMEDTLSLALQTRQFVSGMLKQGIK